MAQGTRPCVLIQCEVEEQVFPQSPSTCSVSCSPFFFRAYALVAQGPLPLVSYPNMLCEAKGYGIQDL